jgi:hypothetical protein
VKTKIIVELDNCRRCPYCKSYRNFNAGLAYDYVCLKAKKEIASYVEYESEFPKEIPVWCPCSLEKYEEAQFKKELEDFEWAGEIV